MLYMSPPSHECIISLISLLDYQGQTIQWRINRIMQRTMLEAKWINVHPHRNALYCSFLCSQQWSWNGHGTSLLLQNALLSHHHSPHTPCILPLHLFTINALPLILLCWIHSLQILRMNSIPTIPPSIPSSATKNSTILSILLVPFHPNP